MNKNKHTEVFQIYFTISILIILLLSILTSHSYSFYSYGQLITNNIENSSKSKDYQTLVYQNNSKPYGVSYPDWTGKWWQWAYSIPKDVNPAYDDSGKFCSEGQSGPVWFLTSSYLHPVERFCSIPYGKSILFTILNSECSFAEFPNFKTETQLRNCAKKMQDSVINLQASINGTYIQWLEQFRIQSPLFNFTIPKYNILDLSPQTTSSVSDGNWVFIKPLPIGNYTISFKGGLKNMFNGVENKSDNFAFAGPYGWDNKVTYRIQIVN